MGLCAFFAVTSWVARDIAATRALCAVLIALVVLRGVSTVYGDNSLYMAIAALVWAVTAMHVFRTGNPTSSSILVISALCYFWTSYTDAPRVVGSLPFVASDVLLVVAMVGIGSSGICALYQRTLDLGRGGGGHGDSPAGLPSEVAR
ncbi:hypothetical protein phiGT1_30 [Sulfitobacter phage phiGT1]|nr:hypothetical protein phiGT1_30 [Sulfitobacter phage phiGT1]